MWCGCLRCSSCYIKFTYYQFRLAVKTSQITNRMELGRRSESYLEVVGGTVPAEATQSVRRQSAVLAPEQQSVHQLNERVERMIFRQRKQNGGVKRTSQSADDHLLAATLVAIADGEGVSGADTDLKRISSAGADTISEADVKVMRQCT